MKPNRDRPVVAALFLAVFLSWSGHQAYVAFTEGLIRTGRGGRGWKPFEQAGLLPQLMFLFEVFLCFGVVVLVISVAFVKFNEWRDRRLSTREIRQMRRDSIENRARLDDLMEKSGTRVVRSQPSRREQ